MIYRFPVQRRVLRVPRARLWREFDPAQPGLARFFNESMAVSVPSFPALNVWRNEEELVVTATVPGVAPEALDIVLEDGTLTLKGERTKESLPEGATYLQQERGQGVFKRSIKLPVAVDVEAISAVFDNGILRITLPFAPEVKPRKIQVSGA